MTPVPSAKSVVVGVIGDPVAHSLSPLLHNAAFDALQMDWVSVGFPVSQHESVEVALRGMQALGIKGLSVTMPHKRSVAHAVDELSDVAKRLDAVNCVVRDETKLVGHNTDGAGFLEALRRGARFDPLDKRCLVVGAGGAARAVVLALANAGAAEVVVVNRTESRAGPVAALARNIGRLGSPDEAKEMDLVVDATPVGMTGVGGVIPLVDPSLLGKGQVAMDLVYDPEKTDWLRGAQSRGALVVGGLGMLVHQAADQITLWTGRPAPVEAMWSAVRRG